MTLRNQPRLHALAALAVLLFLPLACGGDEAAPAPTGGAGRGGSGAGGEAGTKGESGAGGAGAASGAQGDAGAAGTGSVGPDVCDTGSCLSCTACINAATCKQPYQACFEDNPGCTALAQCYLGCTEADCRDTCDAQADAASRTAARAYLRCSLCEACQTTCGQDPSCKSTS